MTVIILMALIVAILMSIFNRTLWYHQFIRRESKASQNVWVAEAGLKLAYFDLRQGNHQCLYQQENPLLVSLFFKDAFWNSDIFCRRQWYGQDMQYIIESIGKGQFCDACVCDVYRITVGVQRSQQDTRTILQATVVLMDNHCPVNNDDFSVWQSWRRWS